MRDLVSAGGILWVILLLTIVEAAGLFALFRLTGRGIAPRSFIPGLLAGDFLVLGWLADRHGWSWMIVALCLAAAGASHVTDFWRRRSQGRRR